MGKPVTEAIKEVNKCALLCRYYAENSERLIKESQTDNICYQPLGIILAVMPWNFPFWQVIRFAVPVLIAGNTLLLKHASNVPQCAIAIQKIFEKAGIRKSIFDTLFLTRDQIERVISDFRIRGVSLTGSEAAGSKVCFLL